MYIKFYHIISKGKSYISILLHKNKTILNHNSTKIEKRPPNYRLLNRVIKLYSIKKSYNNSEKAEQASFLFRPFAFYKTKKYCILAFLLNELSVRPYFQFKVERLKIKVNR